MRIECDGNDLFECSIDGIRWVLKETCEFGCEDGECKEKPAEQINYFLIVLPAIIIAITGIYFLKIRKGSGASSVTPGGFSS